MKRSKNGEGDYEFTRAAYDEVRDSEATHQVMYHVQLDTAQQKGVWLVTVEANGVNADGRVVTLASYRATWPNSSLTTFAAFLYGCTHRVARMVEAVRGVEAAERSVQ
jgi:hypothetical protein